MSVGATASRAVVAALLSAVLVFLGASGTAAAASAVGSSTASVASSSAAPSAPIRPAPSTPAPNTGRHVTGLSVLVLLLLVGGVVLLGRRARDFSGGSGSGSRRFGRDGRR